MGLKRDGGPIYDAFTAIFTHTCIREYPCLDVADFISTQTTVLQHELIKLYVVSRWEPLRLYMFQYY